MSTASKNSSSGTDSSNGVASENENPENKEVLDTAAETGSGKEDKVAYDTYRKLLSEKKKADELLRTYESEKKQREEKDMRAKEDYKALLDARDKELSDERKKRETMENRINTGVKLRAILDGVNGTIEREYFDLLPIDKVVLDPETGMPDPSTVREAIKIVETKFPKIISQKNPKLPPNDAAKGHQGKLTYEQWKQLPADIKAEKMKDVDQSTM